MKSIITTAVSMFLGIFRTFRAILLKTKLVLCKRARSKLSKRFRITLAVLVLLLLYCAIQMPSHSKYYKASVRCHYSVEEKEHLMNLTYQIHGILDSMGFDHWLMFGSIMGAMRFEAPLPWDYDVDLGMHSEDFDKIKYEDFVTKFTAEGIEVREGLAEAGRLHFTKPGGPLEVDLNLFRDFGTGMSGRIGWETWLLPIHYRLYFTFPTRLIKSPLPKSKFGFFEISVPREEHEILKYLYRWNWWKVVKPPSCGVTK